MNNNEPRQNYFVQCVRCGRPLELKRYLKMTMGKRPPSCNQCSQIVEREVIKEYSMWPSAWCGGCVREGDGWTAEVFMRAMGNMMDIAKKEGLLK
jgi:NAD-dependent SIR2 family protein deacetylase